MFWMTLHECESNPLLTLLQGLASMTSVQVKVNRMLLVPPVAFELPLAADPKRSISIAPPTAHIGPAPIQMRLISYELREGQVRRERERAPVPVIAITLTSVCVCVCDLLPLKMAIWGL